jgi:hypothetical protein
MSSKFFRGELHIKGHSLGIPWDTHKREYFSDHEVSHWIRKAVRPIIKQYASLASRFSSAGFGDLRDKELSKPFKGTAKEHKYDTDNSGNLPTGQAPSWKFKGSKKAGKKGKQKSSKGNGSSASEISVTLTADEVSTLLSRFQVSDEDDLSKKFYSCLVAGVAFALTSDQFKQSLKRFSVESAGELSDRVREQLLKAIATKK